MGDGGLNSDLSSVEWENLNLIVCLRTFFSLSVSLRELLSSSSIPHPNYFVMQFKCFEIELFKLIALFCRKGKSDRERRRFKNVDENDVYASGRLG